MAAVILEARCVAPSVVRLRFSDGQEGEANLKPCLFEWEAARGRHEVWSKGLTVGRAGTNTVVVDQEGVAPHHARVTVGGGHHPCYFIEVVEGETAAGGTRSSTPGERWKLPAREPLRLELGTCIVEVE